MEDIFSLSQENKIYSIKKNISTTWFYCTKKNHMVLKMFFFPLFNYSVFLLDFIIFHCCYNETEEECSIKSMVSNPRFCKEHSPIIDSAHTFLLKSSLGTP